MNRQPYDDDDDEPRRSSLPQSLQPLLLNTARDSSTRTTIPTAEDDEDVREADLQPSPIPSPSVYGHIPSLTTSMYHHERRRGVLPYATYDTPAPLLPELEPPSQSRHGGAGPSSIHHGHVAAEYHPRAHPYYPPSEPAYDWQEGEAGSSSTPYTPHYDPRGARLARPGHGPPGLSRSAYSYDDTPLPAHRRETVPYPQQNYHASYSGRHDQPYPSSSLPPISAPERTSGYYSDQPRLMQRDEQIEYARLPSIVPPSVRSWSTQEVDQWAVDERMPSSPDDDRDDDEYKPSGASNRRRRAAPASDQNPKPAKIQKVAIACNFCRGRKLKCDGARPACFNCRGRPNQDVCVYATEQKRRGKGKEPKRRVGSAQRGRGQRLSESLPRSSVSMDVESRPLEPLLRLAPTTMSPSEPSSPPSHRQPSSSRYLDNDSPRGRSAHRNTRAIPSPPDKDKSPKREY